MTGATAVVPGSHKLVPEINAIRNSRMVGEGQNRKYVGPAANQASDLDPFLLNGLTPSVTSITAGDLVVFDTALYAINPISFLSSLGRPRAREHARKLLRAADTCTRTHAHRTCTDVPHANRSVQLCLLVSLQISWRLLGGGPEWRERQWPQRTAEGNLHLGHGAHAAQVERRAARATPRI